MSLEVTIKYFNKDEVKIVEINDVYDHSDVEWFVIKRMWFPVYLNPFQILKGIKFDYRASKILYEITHAINVCDKILHCYSDIREYQTYLSCYIVWYLIKDYIECKENRDEPEHTSTVLFRLINLMGYVNPLEMKKAIDFVNKRMKDHSDSRLLNHTIKYSSCDDKKIENFLKKLLITHCKIRRYDLVFNPVIIMPPSKEGNKRTKLFKKYRDLLKQMCKEEKELHLSWINRICKENYNDL